MSLWPMHPQPQKDELLSSWMVRLAHANRYKVHEFYRQFFGREHEIWNRDIDHFAPDWLFAGLSAHTGVSITRLQDMSLRSFEGIVFEQFRETTMTRGLLSLAVYHRTRRFFGQQFCPLCLLEDEYPYLRKVWRVAFVTICERHQIILHDRCEHCDKPMMPHRADMIHKTGIPMNIGIEFCGSCGKKCTGCKAIKAKPRIIAFQKLIYQSIYTGHISFANEQLYSFIFLEGIRAMAHGVARIDKVRERLHCNKVEIESCDIELRYRLMATCAKFLEDWPSKFISYLSKHKQPYSTFISKNSNGIAPHWIDKAIQTNL